MDLNAGRFYNLIILTINQLDIATQLIVGSAEFANLIVEGLSSHPLGSFHLRFNQ